MGYEVLLVFLSKSVKKPDSFNENLKERIY